METFDEFDTLGTTSKLCRIEVVRARHLPADARRFLTEQEEVCCVSAVYVCVCVCVYMCVCVCVCVCVWQSACGSQSVCCVEVES
jgi:hypothetical protein